MSDDAVSDDRLDAGKLFSRHATFVARFLVRMGARQSELDDLVQEVFLTAHRRGGFQLGGAKPTTWLAEIAVRVLSTQRRTARRRPEHPDDDLPQIATAESSPADRAAAGQLLQRLDRALSELDLEKRAVFVLFELDGEPCDAIASGLGVPLTTVYSRLHEARRQVKESFARLTRDPPRAPTAEGSHG